MGGRGGAGGGLGRATKEQRRIMGNMRAAISKDAHKSAPEFRVRSDGVVEFKIIYRVKPGNSMDKRLKADELLNAIGDWATGKRPDIGTGKRVVSLEPTTRSSLFAVYENGDEDHQILMKMNYEVNT